MKWTAWPLGGAALLALSGCGDSPQLAAFKNIPACKNHSLSEFLTAANADVEWQDMVTQAYGPIVGLVAEFPKESALKGAVVGLQATYQQAGLNSDTWNFRSVAMEMMNKETGQHQIMPNPQWALMMVTQSICASAIDEPKPKG